MEDDLEIFSSRDGDTIWSGKDEEEPEYIYLLFEEAQQKAIDDAENAAQDTSTVFKSCAVICFLLFSFLIT